MSLFSWFRSKTSPAKPRAKPAQTAGAAGARRSAVPAPQATSPEGAQAQRKTERAERRELLFTVVRDAMVRSGVLSASYKFKVLSLDARGRQFLVMMDLARDYAGEIVRLSEIENLITQAAKSRYDILVIAVYWRINDGVAVGVPQKTPPVPTHGAAPAARRSPNLGVPVAAAAVAQQLGGPRTGQRYEPIDADEVAAFKRALAQASAGGPDSVRGSLPESRRPHPAAEVTSMPAPLTGFEDTEMPGNEMPGSQLSKTQYGELR